MPPINEYKCNKCGFSLPMGWGGYIYVQDDNGKRIVCPHPGEGQTVAEVLGLNQLKGQVYTLDKFSLVSILSLQSSFLVFYLDRFLGQRREKKRKKEGQVLDREFVKDS